MKTRTHRKAEMRDDGAGSDVDDIAGSDERVGNSDTGPVLSLQILSRQSSLEHGVMYASSGSRNGD